MLTNEQNYLSRIVIGDLKTLLKSKTISRGIFTQMLLRDLLSIELEIGLKRTVHFRMFTKPEGSPRASTSTINREWSNTKYLQSLKNYLWERNLNLKHCSQFEALSLEKKRYILWICRCSQWRLFKPNSKHLRVLVKMYGRPFLNEVAFQ